MIEENRWKHILAVAQKAKKLATKFKPKDNKFAEDMFLLGLLHDIGYEFSEDNLNHANIGGEILKRNGYKYWQEVALHSDETVEYMTDELFILNCADIMIDINGEEFTFDERLENVAGRYGKNELYKKCLIAIERLKTDRRYTKIS